MSYYPKFTTHRVSTLLDVGTMMHTTYAGSGVLHVKISFWDPQRHLNEQGTCSLVCVLHIPLI